MKPGRLRSLAIAICLIALAGVVYQHSGRRGRNTRLKTASPHALSLTDQGEWDLSKAPWVPLPSGPPRALTYPIWWAAPFRSGTGGGGAASQSYLWSLISA